MRKIGISQDFEDYELDGQIFYFHVDAEIHVEDKDENGQSDSSLYFADISNGCYAKNLEEASEGKYFDMTPEQVKKVEKSLEIEDFRF